MDNDLWVKNRDKYLYNSSFRPSVYANVDDLGPRVQTILSEFGHRIQAPQDRLKVFNQGHFYFDDQKGLCFYDDGPENSLNFDFSLHWKRMWGQGENRVKASPLYRALNLKKFENPLIWDCSCGTGKDTILIQAMGGRNIRAFERNKLIAILVSDALDRLEAHGMGERPFSFTWGDPREYSKQMDQRPDILYFDPMYDLQKKKKKCLPRKEMQLFRNWVGPTEDAEDFLQWALDLQIKRIVVKRGIKSDPLLSGVTSSFKGNSTRYDLYCH